MIKYLILGVIQGLTEFFPVSSSGHLVIMQRLFGITENGLAISVVLHLGTCLSLLVFFWKDIFAVLRSIKLLSLIAVVTLITGAIGICGKDFFENLFTDPKAVAISLVATGIILILTKKFSEHKRKDLNFKDAAILGVTQGIAIIPGISRSGITISTLLFRKLDKETSFRFSFLAAIPAIFGAALLEARHIGSALNSDSQGLFAGFFASFISGIVALGLLKAILNKAKLHYFGYYCIIIAALTLLFIK